MIGTLFEEDEIQQKSTVYNQKTRDDKGHARFTGAFTGAYKEYDVGYRGTCGTEQGWAPKTFVSSRANRAKQSDQNVTDYMDDEDLGKQVIGENLMATADYDQQLKQKEAQLQGLAGNADGTLLSRQFMKSTLIVAKKVSIGYEILKNIKRAKSALLQQQKREEEEEEEEQDTDDPEIVMARALAEERNAHSQNKQQQITDEDYTILEEKRQQEESCDAFFRATFEANARAEFTGLGYNAAFHEEQEDAFETALRERFKQLIKRRDDIIDEKELQEAKAKNRVYMSLDEEADEKALYTNTALDVEEDEDQQQNEEAEKLKLSEQPRKMIKTLARSYSALSQMTVRGAPYQVPQNHKPLPVPADYDMLARLKRINQEYYSKVMADKINGNLGRNGRIRMNVDQRTEALEGKANLEAMKKQLPTKKFVKGAQQEMGGDDMQELFDMDRDKSERFRYFCLEKQGRMVGGIPPGNMNYEQIMRERAEFESLYALQEQKKQEQQGVIQKINELEQKIFLLKNFRKREKWFPNKLLCKRFGCVPPYKDQEYHYYLKVQEAQQQQEQAEKERKINDPLTAEKAEELKQKAEASELKMYGLPTSFKANHRARFQSAGYQSGDQIVPKGEGAENADSDDDDDDESEDDARNDGRTQKQAANQSKQAENENDTENETEKDQPYQQEVQELPEQEPKPPLDLFKSIFDDDEEENQ